nr:ComEC/Rec2 family competence protein [Cellulomonas denverensis]
MARDLPGDAGALLPGVTVGDTSGVGDLDAAMKGSGLAHITAVSGAHFSMVGTAVLLVSSWCGVPRRWRWLPVTAVSIGFVVLVGPGPTVVRAALMGGVGVLGVAVGRPSRAVPALCVAVLGLLVADPWLCADLGFLLSVVATAGIALVAAPLAAAWPGRLPAGVALALAVPVAAQAACAPVILLLDPAVAVYAVPANVIAAPAVGPATLGGLAAACFAGWCPPVAEAAAAIAGAACWWIGTVARVAVALPGARLSWLSGWPGLVLLAVATAAGTALLLRCRRGMAP